MDKNWTSSAYHEPASVVPQHTSTCVAYQSNHFALSIAPPKIDKAAAGGENSRA